jgi:hypothetical protein
MIAVLLEVDHAQTQSIFTHSEAGIPYMDLVQLAPKFFGFGDFWGESNYNKVKLRLGSVAVTETNGSYHMYTEASSLADLRAQNRSWYYTDYTIYLHINNWQPWWLQQSIELGVVQGYSNIGYHSETAYFDPRLVTDGLIVGRKKDPLFVGLMRYEEKSFSLLNGDGALDQLASEDHYGNACRLKLEEESGFIDLYSGRVYAVPRVQAAEAQIAVQDKRKFLSRKIPVNRFNKTNYPNLEDKNVGKRIPLAWGRCRYISLTPIASYQFKICDPLDYGGIKAVDAVYVDETAVTPASIDLVNCTLTLNSADAEAYSEKVTADVQGYKDGAGILIENGLYVIRELLRLYANTEYTSSNYDTNEWDSYESSAPEIAFFVEDADLNEVLEKIAYSMFGIFYVKGDGRYSFKKTDESRAVVATIPWQKIINEVEAEYDEESFLTSVDVHYDPNWAADEFKIYADSSREGTIFQKYKRYRNKEFA